MSESLQQYFYSLAPASVPDDNVLSFYLFTNEMVSLREGSSILLPWNADCSVQIRMAVCMNPQVFSSHLFLYHRTGKVCGLSDRDQYTWAVEVYERVKALHLLDFFLLNLGMCGVTSHAEVIKCIHQMAVDADSETNAYTTFMQDYFSSMDGYLRCLHADLDILEGLF